MVIFERHRLPHFVFGARMKLCAHPPILAHCPRRPRRARSSERITQQCRRITPKFVRACAVYVRRFGVLVRVAHERTAPPADRSADCMEPAVIGILCVCVCVCVCEFCVCVCSVSLVCARIHVPWSGALYIATIWNIIPHKLSPAPPPYLSTGYQKTTTVQ